NSEIECYSRAFEVSLCEIGSSFLQIRRQALFWVASLGFNTDVALCDSRRFHHGGIGLRGLLLSLCWSFRRGAILLCLCSKIFQLGLRDFLLHLGHGLGDGGGLGTHYGLIKFLWNLATE